MIAILTPLLYHLGPLAVLLVMAVVFAQVAAPSFYHATLEVVPVDATHSRIVCTLLSALDPAVTPEAAAAAAAQRQTRFQAAVDKMKAAAEAP